MQPIRLLVLATLVLSSRALAAPPPVCPLEASSRPYFATHTFVTPPDPPLAGATSDLLALEDNCAWAGEYQTTPEGISLVQAATFEADPPSVEITAADLARMRSPPPGERLGSTDIYVTLRGAVTTWPDCYGVCVVDGNTVVRHTLIKPEDNPDAAEATFDDASYTFRLGNPQWGMDKAPGQSCTNTTSCTYRMWFQLGSNGSHDGQTHYQLGFRKDQQVLLTATHTDVGFSAGQSSKNFIPFEVRTPKMPDMADADFGWIPSASAADVVLIEGSPALKVGAPYTLKIHVADTGNGPMINPSLSLESVSAILTQLTGPVPPWPARIERRASFDTTYTYSAHAAGRLEGRRVEVAASSVRGQPFSFVTHGPALTVTDSVSVKVTVDDSRLVLQEDTIAHVRVTSIAPTPVDVSFPNGLLVADHPERVTIGAVPAVQAVYTLTPSDPTIELEVPVRGADGGSTELVSTIAFPGVAGPATAFGEARVTVSPLLVELVMRPLVAGKPIVGMVMRPDGTLTDLDDDPVDPQLLVRVTNTGSKGIEASLESLYPQARDHSPVLDRLDILASATAPVKLPIDLQTIAAGATLEKTFPLAIYENGRFAFYASVQGHVPGEVDSGFRAVVSGAPIAVGAQFPVSIEFKLADPTGKVAVLGNGAVLVAPGGWVPVIATVTNNTSNATLKFRGIEVDESAGNAGNALLTELAQQTSCPIRPGEYELAPKEAVVLSGNIYTMKNGAPKGDLQWQLPQDAELTDDASGDHELLDDVDYLVTSDFGGWLGETLAVRVVQDERRPIYPPLGLWPRAGYFAEGVMVGIGGWFHGNIDALVKLGGVLADPSALADKVGEGARHVWEGMELMANTWAEMSPADQDAFIVSVGDEVLRIANLDPLFELQLGDITQAYQTVRDVTYPLFASIEQAYATNDPAAIAGLYGRISGNVIMEVAMCFAPTPRFSQYTEGAEVAKLAKATDVAEAATEQARFLTDVPSGPVSEAIARSWWGTAGDELELTQKIFKVLNVKGYMRERAPEAFDLINRWAEAVWKPESMKPKGLSDIDLMILGGADKLPQIAGRNRQLDLKGITALFEPEADAIIEARVRAQTSDENLVKACLERARFRRQEIQEYAPKFADYLEEGIPVNRNYADNGLTNPSDAIRPNRAFEVESVAIEGGPTLRIPKMADEGGVLKYISGDIDWVHFSFLDGTPLDSDTARLLYDLMHRYVGMQHPETITWIKLGQAVFKGKANQLVDFLKGGKALLEVSGDELRATRIVPELTRFKNTGRAHLIYFDNSAKSLEGFISAADQLERYYRALDSLPSRKLLLPFLWFGRSLDSDTSMGGCDWQYSGSDNGLMLRQTHAGVTEQYRDGAWVPFTLPPACTGANALDLTPVTQTSETVPAGTSEVPISELASDWANALVGHLDKWFEPGDTVVFAPGEASQEVRVVTALGSLILDRPLDHEHPAGTLVAVVPPGTIIAEPNPEVAPEQSPETSPEVGPEPTAEAPVEAADDVAEVSKHKSDGGCSGGSPNLLALALVLVFIGRTRRRRFSGAPR